MSIHEECGVFGVCRAKTEDVASPVYYGPCRSWQGRSTCAIICTPLCGRKRCDHADSTGYGSGAVGCTEETTLGISTINA